MMAIQIAFAGYASDESNPPATPKITAISKRVFEFFTLKAYFLSVVAVCDYAALHGINSILCGFCKRFVVGLRNLI